MHVPVLFGQAVIMTSNTAFLFSFSCCHSMKTRKLYSIATPQPVPLQPQQTPHYPQLAGAGWVFEVRSSCHSDVLMFHNRRAVKSSMSSNRLWWWRTAVGWAGTRIESRPGGGSREKWLKLSEGTATEGAAQTRRLHLFAVFQCMKDFVRGRMKWNAAIIILLLVPVWCVKMSNMCVWTKNLLWLDTVTLSLPTKSFQVWHIAHNT